jgi:hypothetical protein
MHEESNSSLATTSLARGFAHIFLARRKEVNAKNTKKEETHQDCSFSFGDTTRKQSFLGDGLQIPWSLMALITS